MRRLPMHPRYSRMLIEASKYGCVRAAALCAALVSGRDLLQRLRREDKHISEARELFEASQDSDFFTLMRAYQFAKKNNFNTDQCRRYGIHAQSARHVEQTHQQIVQICEQQRLLQSDEKADDSALLRCLMTGFIDQLCIRRDLGTLECELTEHRTGTLVRESVVQNSPLFVVASIREVLSRGSENLTLLSLASAVKREWVEETFPQQIHSKVEHLFDRTHKRVSAVRLVRFWDLVIYHEHQRDPEPVASARCLAEAYRKEYFELPLFNHELKQFIARVNLVCAAMPELEFPPFDEKAITECLTRAFAGMTLVKEAQATHLRDEFAKHLAREQLAWLDELAPLTLPWPDGKKLKLLYAEETLMKGGEPNPPELQVKLTECFALKEHPRICEGNLPVKIWLCTPDGRRIESTFNWPAFKANNYPKLKPALQKEISRHGLAVRRTGWQKLAVGLLIPCLMPQRALKICFPATSISCWPKTRPTLLMLASIPRAASLVRQRSPTKSAGMAIRKEALAELESLSPRELTNEQHLDRLAFRGQLLRECEDFENGRFTA